MAHQTTVCEGDHVVFKTDDKTKVFQLVKKRTIYFEKSKIRPEDIIGKKYGTLFEFQKGKLVVVIPEKSYDATMGATAGEDNRDLVASGENQKLSQEEIMKMKEEGMTGKDIIEKLVEQSETFKTKTAFSQEKYIKKKKKKHLLVFRVLRPNSSLLMDLYKQTPGKICHLRADSLSQLLCYSNVMSGSTVAVVESCHGLVLGSVMERMGGKGRVVHLYPGNDMNRHLVQDFNFCKEQSEILLDFPLNKLASLEKGTLLVTSTASSADHSGEDGDTAKAGCTVDIGGSDDGASSEGSGSDAEKEEDADRKEGASDSSQRKRSRQKDENSERRARYEARRHQRLSRIKEAATVLQEKNLDSLIIATKYDPVTLLQRLLPYVGPSRPVVVFSQHKEPLVECFTQVKESGSGLQMKLFENWYREYQVLPSRTHPLTSMSGTGGYLLSFIRIAS